MNYVVVRGTTYYSPTWNDHHVAALNPKTGAVIWWTQPTDRKFLSVGHGPGGVLHVVVEMQSTGARTLQRWRESDATLIDSFSISSASPPTPADASGDVAISGTVYDSGGTSLWSYSTGSARDFDSAGKLYATYTDTTGGSGNWKAKIAQWTSSGEAWNAYGANDTTARYGGCANPSGTHAAHCVLINSGWSSGTNNLFCYDGSGSSRWGFDLGQEAISNRLAAFSDGAVLSTINPYISGKSAIVIDNTGSLAASLDQTYQGLHCGVNADDWAYFTSPSSGTQWQHQVHGYDDSLAWQWSTTMEFNILQLSAGFRL